MAFNITSSKTMEDTMEYTPVSKDESLDDDSYTVSPQVTASFHAERKPQGASPHALSNSRRSWAGRTITILNVALFVASIALFLKSSNVTTRQNWALEQVSYFCKDENPLTFACANSFESTTFCPSQDTFR
jgi:hypothetical protein